MSEIPSKEQKPPIFKSWRTLYGMVLVFHLLMISLFTWITSLFT